MRFLQQWNWIFRFAGMYHAVTSERYWCCKRSQCLQNIGKYVPSDKASRPRWLESKVSFSELFKPHDSMSLDANPTWLMLGTLRLTMHETWTLRRVSRLEVTEAHTSRIKISHMLFIIKTTYKKCITLANTSFLFYY